MSIINEDILREIKKICDKYDSYYGEWPESKYEGRSIYHYISKEIENDSKLLEGK